MTRNKRFFTVAVAVAGALALSTKVYADAYAVAYSNILNLEVITTREDGTGGPVYIPLANFTAFSTLSRSAANLNGDGQTRSVTARGPADVQPSFGTGSVFPGATPANNNMVPVGQFNNYSRSDSQIVSTLIQQLLVGGPITLTGTTTQAWGIAETRIAVSGNGDADSRNSSETGFTTISLPAPARIRIKFEADPYLQVALGATSGGTVNAGINATVSLSKVPGGLVFEWKPNGLVGGITGGQEITDGGNLNTGEASTTPGDTQTYDPTGDNSSGSLNPATTLKYEATTDVLPAGVYTLSLDLQELVNITTNLIPPREPYDWGDNPDTSAGTGPGNYNTTEGDNGPSHRITGPFLGRCVDGDDGTFQSIGADADDLIVGETVVGTCVGNDDEDGVTLPANVMRGQQYNAVINMPVGASGEACVVDGWIDFNSDGDFNDQGEKIIDGQSFPSNSGKTPVAFLVPSDAALGSLYSRFRCSRAGGLSPTGSADNGEVEDYRIRLTTSTESIPAVSYSGLALLALMLFAVVALRKRHTGS